MNFIILQPVINLLAADFDLDFCVGILFLKGSESVRYPGYNGTWICTDGNLICASGFNLLRLCEKGLFRLDHVFDVRQQFIALIRQRNAHVASVEQ